LAKAIAPASPMRNTPSSASREVRAPIDPDAVEAWIKLNRKRRAIALAELARGSRDPTWLATLVRAAGKEPGQGMVDFILRLKFEARSPAEAHFLSALLSVIASGNDARSLLGIDKATTGHRKRLAYLDAAVHEIAMRMAEGDSQGKAIEAVAEIVGDDVDNLKREYHRHKKKWPRDMGDAYSFRAAVLNKPIKRSKDKR